jgi:hypothetical protein
LRAWTVGAGTTWRISSSSSRPRRAPRIGRARGRPAAAGEHVRRRGQRSGQAARRAAARHGDDGHARAPNAGLPRGNRRSPSDHPSARIIPAEHSRPSTERSIPVRRIAFGRPPAWPPRVGAPRRAVAVVVGGVPGRDRRPAAGRSRRPAALRRGGQAAGVEHAYDGDFDLLRRRRRGRLRLRRRRLPDLYFAGGSEPAGPLPQRQRGRRRAAFRTASLGTRDRPAAVTGAYPLDIDGDGITDLAVLRAARTCCCAASATAASSGRTRRGASTAATPGRPPSAPPGRRRGAAHPRLRQLPRRGQPDRDRRVPRQRAVRPEPGGRLRRPAALSPAGARCRCCSATGTAPAGATCASATTATTTATGRSSCGGSSRAMLSRGPTRGGRLAAAAHLGHGHRQPRPDRRRLPRGVPDQPGRQQAPDAGRRAGPAGYERHRPRAAA